MERRLYRSRTQRMISGVCGGIAEYYAVDPALVRLLALLATVVSFGGALVAYLVMSIVVPESPASGDTQEVTRMPDTSGGQPASSTTPMPPAQSPQPVATAPPPGTPPAAPGGTGAPGDGSRRRGGGIVFGVVLVFLGVGLLASQFIPGLDLWRLWPLILVAIGLSVIFRGGRQ